MLITIASSGTAVAAVGAGEASSIFSPGYLLQVTGSLLLVFGFLFGLAWLLKNKYGMPQSDRKSIQVLASAKVGAREKILLVTAGERQLLVGVAAGNVRTLYVFENADEMPFDAGSAGPADFSSVMGASAAGMAKP